MKIEILEPYGFCPGVQRAISLVYETKEKYPDKKIHILGQIVHNTFVSNNLDIDNIDVSNYPGDLVIDYIDQHFNPSEDIILYPAHGHTTSVEKYLKKKGYTTIDTQCNVVKTNFKKIEKELKSGHQVIWIGHENHAETKAVMSLSNEVYQYGEYLLNNDYIITDKAPYIANQSSLNALQIEEDYQKLLEKYPDARVQREVCPIVKERQDNIRNLPSDVDAIIVVGDTNSSNTSRLYEVAQSSHPDCYSIMVSNSEGININALKDKEHIVITSGAATPEEVVQEVYRYLASNLYTNSYGSY
ncbi:MAG: 4-hydroxy-3-methylbut-2-enyl diphosphate reductase [Coprobacillus sp.]|nr:4-hydroxy-3-methylbut-2-enyl diphosphate reductase [Coprobacillus sp.]